MKTVKHTLLLILLSLLGFTQVHAQLEWARSFDISAAIPGATWVDISKVIKVDQNRFIVAGTVTGTGNQSLVIARFSPDGVPGWVREIKGAPGSTIQVNDIVECKNAATPGYAICGEYSSGGGNTENYLARIDDLGNLQWDHVWQNSGKLISVIFASNNDIVTTGYALSGFGVLNTTIHRFDNAGSMLISKMLSSDPTIKPVDLLEDPLFNATGGFFILVDYTAFGNPSEPAYVFVDNGLNFVQGRGIPYPLSDYAGTHPVAFEQDVNTRELYILTNTQPLNPFVHDYRPSVIKCNPAVFAPHPAQVLISAAIPTSDVLLGTDIILLNGDATRGIMVTAVQQLPGSVKSHTWNLVAAPALASVTFNEQWLGVPNVRNMSLCQSKDNQHYVLAGHDAGNNLTLNVVNLDGNKIANDGSSTCVTLNSVWVLQPKFQPNAWNYSTINLPFNPVAVSTSDERSWWYNNACDCAEEPLEQTYRHAYPQIPYDAWELDINRAGYDNSNGHIYISNTIDLPMDRPYILEVGPMGQDVMTYVYLNGGGDEHGRQAVATANGEKIIITRLQAGGQPVLNIMRWNGPTRLWETYFPNTQTPGRVYVAENPASGDIIVVADIDGPDATSNTHDLMIARFNSGGGLLYYKEIPVLYNGASRDYFKVLSLEPTRDDGFALCGSSGDQGADFIAGHVMKFDGTGPTGTLDWQYVFRRQTSGGCYDLNGPMNCRSASVFYQLRQSGPNGYYVAGYTSDHDQNGQNASFWNGLVVRLDLAGNELAVQEYADNAGRWTTFKGITQTPADIAIAGSLVDPGNNDEGDLFVRISKSTLGVAAAQTYGHTGSSSLLDIFRTGVASGNPGYTMVGRTTDWYGVLTPQVVSTDNDGVNGCEIGVVLNPATPVNDPVTLDLDPAVDRVGTLTADEELYTCVEVFDICEPTVAAAIRPVHTGDTDFGNMDKVIGKDIVLYPNPASTMLNLNIPQDIAIYELAIFDINGREVYRSTRTMNDHMEINISELPEGVYAVKMETNTGKRITRFIKL